MLPNGSIAGPAFPAGVALLAGALAATAAGQGMNGGPAPAQESDYYAVDHLALPEGERIEVGGLGFLPDGRLAVSTRRGQVWLVENALDPDPQAARWSLFAEGLQEGLGLEVEERGTILVLQRSELSRLVDEDGDGRCDRVETVSQGWGNSGHYHEFGFGLPSDPRGNRYVALNVSFDDQKWWHGRSDAPYRGWVLRVAPDGSWTPFASGVRSPAGLGTTADGRILLTDNQGDWVPACPIVHVQEGRFYGHPASLNWTDAYQRAKRTASYTIPPERERADAAVWIPYDWSRSAGSLVADTTAGKFGPFREDLFVAELTNGYVLRAQLEEVQGELQGAVMPFRKGVGSAVRVAFAPDGTLLAGLTDRGWGGQPPTDGVARLRWTGVLPMEMQRVHLLQDGFEIDFTLPLAEGAEVTPEQVRLEQYDYDWWWEYGSPVRHQVERRVAAIDLSPDRRTLALRFDALEPGMVARLKLTGIVGAGGVPLLHEEMAYTVNQLPEGPRRDAHVAKEVPPPPPREVWEEGVLRLSQGDALDVWRGEGWTTADVRLDREEPARLAFVPPKLGEDGAPEPVDPHGPRTLTNAGAESAGDLVTRFELGDVDLNATFMLPKGGNSGIYLMGRYEVQLLDSAGKKELTFGDCGGIYQGRSDAWPGRAPDFNAFRGPGEWHNLTLSFRAPRFDAQGNKVENARFLRVMIDDVLLHEDVEVPGVTGGAISQDEAPTGPLRLQGDHGPVAFRHIVVRDRAQKDRTEADGEGWVRIFDGESLEGWKVSDGGQWKVDGGAIVGTGPVSHLFSPRGDYRDFELRARCRINQGGNSGVYFRTAFGPGYPKGYEAQVNSTHSDPVKTGSLYGLSLIQAPLIPADVWFTQHITCRDEPEGTRIEIRVNGMKVNEFLDTERRYAEGHFAFQQHHEGSVVRYRDVEVRDLR